MTYQGLTDEEISCIGECLREAAYGKYFPDWEFSTLFGIERDILQEISDSWPDVNDDDIQIREAILNSINNLTGYPHGREKNLLKNVSFSIEQLLFFKKKLKNLFGYS